MTTNEIYLPMGDPENNYTLRLLVYIYDVYDDYNVSEITITVSYLGRLKTDVTIV